MITSQIIGFLDNVEHVQRISVVRIKTKDGKVYHLEGDTLFRTIKQKPQEPDPPAP